MKDPIFKANPKLENYFKTVDGNAFFTEHDAKNHATSLKSKKVEKVERPFVKEKAKATPVIPIVPVATKKSKKEAKDKKKTSEKTAVKKDASVDNDTNVDNASYAELILFTKDNEVELSSKKTEDVRKAVKEYLANSNKEIVPFKGDLN